MRLMFTIQGFLQLDNVVTSTFCLSEVQSLKILSRSENVSNEVLKIIEKTNAYCFLIGP